MTKSLAGYLELTEEEVDAMELENYLQPSTGNSGEMVYSYYFEVPACTPKEVLEKKDWYVGQLIPNIPLNIVD